MDAFQKREQINQRIRAFSDEAVKELVAIAEDEYRWQRFHRGVWDQATAEREAHELVKGVVQGLRERLSYKMQGSDILGKV